MRQKKALSYVDLAVSAGVFILYLVIAIAVFKPGIKSDFRPDILTSIVEENIKNEIYWQAQRIPIFINTQPICVSKSEIYSNLEFHFPFDKSVINNKTARLLDQDLRLLDFEIDNIVNPNFTVQYNFACAGTLHKDIIYVAYFPQANLSPQITPTGGFTYSSDTTYSVKYGVKETLKGVSPDRFASFNSLDYAITKRKWGYPDSRDFSVEIFQGTNITESSNPIYSYQKAYPATKEVSVYAIEYADLMLYENTTRQVVTIRIKTW